MKQLKSIYRYLGIALIVVICFTAISTYFFLSSDNAVGPNLITAFVGVVLSALITLLLLNGQTNAEEFKQKNIKVFEEKLAIYKEFLKSLCDVVKDNKIDPEEEILLQFQVANLATHTKSESIQKISEQVRDIILSIKQDAEENNLMLGQLFNIADVFYKELYDEDNMYDETKRILAIDNFRSFLIPSEQLQSYEQSNKKQRAEAFKSYKTIEERLQYLSGRLNVPCERQWIYNGYILVHEYNNDVSESTGRIVKGENRIIVDLSMDDSKIQISLFTRRYDENESRDLVNGIWQGKVSYNPFNENTRHLFAELPVETSDEEIVAKMTQLLNDVKLYRDKKHHLVQ